MEKVTTLRGIKIALASYIVILALQLVSYFMSGTLVLLAMAFETVASILIAAFLLLAAYYSQKPADDIHMLGYERAQNVAAVVSAIVFISVMSVETFRRAISKFFEAPGVSQFQNVGLAFIVSAVSILMVTIPVIHILRTKGKGASLKAQLVSSLEDVVAYVVGLIGIALIAKGYYLADPIASTVVGILIALAGVYLIKDNVRYLMGKGPGQQYIDKVESAVKSVEGVRDMHNFKAEYVGPDNLFIGFHIKVARGTPIEEADRIAQEVKKRVGGEIGCKHCVIQVEPED